MTHSRVLQMVMDSLRYWIVEMHVDGFRFDLATTLARGPRGEFAASPFFAAITQDPVISTAKLIAEPWDVGEGGYRVGNFPVNWKEWNGKYRDGVRDFWRGADGSMGEFASRVTGSSDLYRAGGRAPLASINFVTSHDGFTLTDLVSYNEKHNEANGEDNRDGDEPESIVELRRRRADRRSRDSRASRAAKTQLPGDADPVAGRADDSPRRRARPHAARQQQRLLPGQSNFVDRLAERRRGADRVHAAADPDPSRASDFPAPGMVHRASRESAIG